MTLKELSEAISFDKSRSPYKNTPRIIATTLGAEGVSVQSSKYMYGNKPTALVMASFRMIDPEEAKIWVEQYLEKFGVSICRMDVCPGDTLWFSVMTYVEIDEE